MGLKSQVSSPKPLEVSIRVILAIESMEVETRHFTHGSQVLSPKPLEVSIRAISAIERMEVGTCH